MMGNTHRVSKAFILRINDPKSIEYAQCAADSCDAVGLDWKYFDGYSHMSGKDAWSLTGIEMRWPTVEPVTPHFIYEPPEHCKAECASAGHAAIWKKIVDGPDECVIILEHDAIMLHPLDIEVPDYKIAVLGYKIKNPERYDHESAGPTTEWVNIDGHEGAHAYALTKTTAQFLLDEIDQSGILGQIDNAYFIRRQRRTQIPLVLASPTSALGWLRESTIWAESSTANYRFIDSFDRFYK